MFNTWFKGCTTNEEKERRADTIRNGRPTLSILEEVLNERVKELTAGLLDEEKFSGKEWALMQARLVGRVKGLTDVLDLIKSVDQPPRNYKPKTKKG